LKKLIAILFFCFVFQTNTRKQLLIHHDNRYYEHNTKRKIKNTLKKKNKNKKKAHTKGERKKSMKGKKHYI